MDRLSRKSLVSPFDSPVNVVNNGTKLSWTEVNGAEYYNVFQVVDSTTGTVNLTQKIKFIQKVTKNEFILDNNFKYLVSAVDKNGFESPPVNETYKGLDYNIKENKELILIGYTNNIIQPMNSYTSVEGKVTSSGEYSTSYPAYNAFNRIVDTRFGWVSNSKTAWLELEFSNSKRINKYTITMRYSSLYYHPNEAPKTWNFEAWDGSRWVVLDQRVNIQGFSYNVKKEFTFENQNFYKRYRLNILDNYGHPSTTGIGELELMEGIYDNNA